MVRPDNGLVLVAHEVGEVGGSYLREADPFHPEKAGNATWCVVGGLLPPGAVSAGAVDDRGTRVAAAVAEGAYAALLEQPIDGYEPIVCCRDANGDPVRRPWAADYPSVRVTDTQEPCPACGATDWDEYTPFEEWRGGRGGPDGTRVPSPVVSCRVCGHEKEEGVFITRRSRSDESEDEAARAARIARLGAQQRKRRWLSDSTTLRAAHFPIYGADGWPARIGGNGSQDDQLTEITIYHYETPDADPYAGDPPRLTITTKRDKLRAGEMLGDARRALEDWIGRSAGAARWPDASHAAITLWLRARDRERRGAVLDAVQSEQLVAIDGVSTTTLMLTAPGSRWVAVARHGDLTIIVAAFDLEPVSLRVEPIADLAAQLLGPESEPPDA